MHSQTRGAVKSDSKTEGSQPDAEFHPFQSPSHPLKPKENVEGLRGRLLEALGTTLQYMGLALTLRVAG